MSGPRQRALAVLFSVLLVTVGFGPALAEPPGGEQGGPPDGTPGGSDNPGNGPPSGPADGTPTATPTSTSTPSSPSNGPDGGPGRGPPDDDSDDGPGHGPSSEPPGNGDGPPSNAGPPSDGPSDRSNGSNSAVNTSVSLDERGSALAHRLTAIALLRNASLRPGHGGAKAERYAALLNDTRQHVLDVNRTTSAALFRDDKRVVAPVHRRAPTVAAHLLVSESILAETAIDDAHRVRDELRARNVSFNESTVAEQLHLAERSYRQGERLRDRDSVSPGAVEHYRRAWTHAQRALDLMDEAVIPQVTVRVRVDFPHTEAFNRTVDGTVFDVRPHELNGTLTVANESRPLALNASTRPGAVATFNTSVRLPAQTANQSTVLEPTPVARDPGVDVADRGYDAEDQRDLHDPQRGIDALALDGDGLLDIVERRVTDTHPLDPDSNSTETTANEAGDGTLDGGEDFDGDGLVTFVELHAGTDPLDPDTDGDGLPDGIEQRLSGLSPTTNDTDHDGIPDPTEDLDDGTLSTAREVALNTTPTLADTDADGLSDGAEVRTHGTDPLARATDDDGLSDAEEVDLPTDPTVADTDGDGTLDGDEMFTTETTDEETGVAVSVTGEGNAAAAVTVTNATRKPRFNASGLAAARASKVVDVSVPESVEQARVTVPYDPARVTDESDLAVYHFNATLGTFVRLKSTVDAANDTVTATATQFSPVAVLSVSEWQSRFDEPLPSRWSVEESFTDLDSWSTAGNVSLRSGGVVVASTAMEDDDGGGDPPPEDPDCEVSTADADCDGDGLTNAEESSLGTDPLDPDTDGDGLSDGAELQHDANPLVVDTDGDGLSDGAEVHVHFTEPNEADSDGGGTNDGQEIDAGTNPNDPNDDPLSQSLGDGPTATQSAATRQVSIPAGTDVVELQAEVAGSAGANGSARVVVEGDSFDLTVFEVADGGEQSGQVTVDLSSFAGETVTIRLTTQGDAQLAVESVKLAFDTDGDGLTDPIERHGLRTGTGEIIHTDPAVADSDGDGLEDGAEVSRVDGSGIVSREYFVIHSEPTIPDSDRDGVNDFDERRVWNSFPFIADSDGDGYTDLVDSDVDADSAPPSIRFRSKLDDFSSQLTVEISDRSDIESVTITAQYMVAVPVSDNVTDNVATKVLDPTSTERVNATTVAVSVFPPREGTLGTPPIGYVVNATDSEGNTISVRVTLNGSESAKAVVVDSSVESHASGISAAGILLFGSLEAEVSVAGAAGAGSGATLSATGIGAALLIGFAAVTVYVAVESQRFQARELLAGSAVSTETLAGGKYAHVPPTGEAPAATFPAPFSGGGELTLPSGRQYGAPTGQPQNPRQWGWEQIRRLPGVQSPEIVRDIFRSPENVLNFGRNGHLVIGDNPQTSNDLIFWVTGGVVVRAWSGQVIRDPLGRSIVINRNNRHPVNDKNVNYDEIERTVRNPDQIWRGPNLDHYVRKINGKWVIVRVFKHLGWWTISTAVVKKTKQAAREYIEDDTGANDRIHGPDWPQL